MNIEEYAYDKETRRRFSAIYEQIPPETDQILDIGCARYNKNKRSGTNLHRFLIEQTNAEVYGIDVDEDAVSEMREDGYNVEVADAQEYDIDNEFDVIIAGEVIEYLPNPGEFIKTSMEHLSKNGRIIITTENPNAFFFYRGGLTGREFKNLIWLSPDKIGNISDNVTLDTIQWISPAGGVSKVLWLLGFKKASAPRFCAVLVGKDT